MVKIYINRLEKKFTKTNNKVYYRAETNQGVMNIFGNIVYDEILKHPIPGEFEVVVKESNGFKNIDGITPPEFVTEKEAVSDGPETNKSEMDYDKIKFASMAISYAKDLAVAGKIEVTNIRKEAQGFMDLYDELKSEK